MKELRSPKSDLSDTFLCRCINCFEKTVNGNDALDRKALAKDFKLSFLESIS